MNSTNFRETPWNKPFLMQRADPYMYRHTDGTYYFTGSVPEYDRIVLRSAKTMEGLKTAAEKILWTRHESGPRASISGHLSYITWTETGTFIMRQGKRMIPGKSVPTCWPAPGRTP